MKLILLCTLLTAFTLRAGPDKKAAPDAAPAADTKPAAEAKAGGIEVGALTFKAAAPWVVKKEPRRMSAGGLTIPGKGEATGVEADFYHFGGPGGGGDNEANIKRWQGQFQPDEDGKLPEGKREEVALGGKKLIMVTFKGTFLSGSVMDAKRTPMPGYTMTGIIIPTDDGSAYIKINGPDAAMTAAQEQIKALVKSAFPSEK